MSKKDKKFTIGYPVVSRVHIFKALEAEAARVAKAAEEARAKKADADAAAAKAEAEAKAKKEAFGSLNTLENEDSNANNPCLNQEVVGATERHQGEHVLS